MKGNYSVKQLAKLAGVSVRTQSYPVYYLFTLTNINN